jgi:plastocyanin
MAFILAFIVGLGMSSERKSEIKHHQIVITGFNFEPKELKVSLGDKVTWTNNDIVPHNVINLLGEKKPISTDLANGESFTFMVKDSLTYECGFHPSMKGKLILSTY